MYKPTLKQLAHLKSALSDYKMKLLEENPLRVNTFLLKNAEVRKLLNLSRTTVLNYTKRGILPGRKIGDHYHYRCVEILKYLSQNSII